MNKNQLITLMGALSALSGCRDGGAKTEFPEEVDEIIMIEKGDKDTIEFLDEMLARLADTPAPDARDSQATCYLPGFHRENAFDFVCRKCDRRITYEVVRDVAEENDSKVSVGTIFDLQRFRRCMEQLSPLGEKKGLKIFLDESHLCPHCKTHGRDKLALTVVHPDGKEYTNVIRFEEELLMLSAFLEGKVYWTGYPGRTPVKASIPRIQHLLGLGSKPYPVTLENQEGFPWEYIDNKYPY